MVRMVRRRDAKVDRDLVRQAAVVAATVGGVVSGATGDYGDGPQTPNLTVPAHYAFTVWAPIYAGSLAYAARQVRPAARTDPLLRRTGWPAAAAFGLAGCWVRVQSHPRLQLGLIGATAVATAVAYRRASPLPGDSAGRTGPRGEAATPAGPGVDRAEAVDRWTVRIPLGLFAGWISLATAAGGIEALLAARDGTLPVSVPVSSAGALGLASTAAVAVIATVPVSTAFPVAVAWGLVGTAVRALDRTACAPPSPGSARLSCSGPAPGTAAAAPDSARPTGGASLDDPPSGYWPVMTLMLHPTGHRTAAGAVDRGGRASLVGGARYAPDPR